VSLGEERAAAIEQFKERERDYVFECVLDRSAAVCTGEGEACDGISPPAVSGQKGGRTERQVSCVLGRFSDDTHYSALIALLNR